MTRDQILNEILNHNSQLRAEANPCARLEIQTKIRGLFGQLNQTPHYELKEGDFRAL